MPGEMHSEARMGSSCLAGLFFLSPDTQVYNVFLGPMKQLVVKF